MDRRRLIFLSAATVGAAALSVVEPATTSAFRDRDCSDFSSQRQAQRFYKKQQKRTGQRDAHRLDADRDGVACEELR